MIIESVFKGLCAQFCADKKPRRMQPTDGQFYLEREAWDEVFLQMLSETCLEWEAVGLFA